MRGKIVCCITLGILGVILTSGSINAKTYKLNVGKTKKVVSSSIKNAKYKVVSGKKYIKVSIKGVVTGKAVGKGVVKISGKTKSNKSTSKRVNIKVICKHKYITSIKGVQSCTESSVVKTYCKICGIVKSKECKNALGHKFKVIHQERDCNHDGYTLHTCSVCGYSYKTDKIEKIGEHVYRVKTVEPTCTKQGYTEYTCKLCGYSYSDDIVQATGEHTIDTSTVKYETDTSSNSETGYNHILIGKCTGCGTVLNVKESCEFESKSKEVTCESEGGTWRECTYCHNIIDANLSPAKGHNWGTEITRVEPTCKEEGKLSVVCETCGVDKSDSVIKLPKIDHTYTYEILSNADCTHAEKSMGVCSMCSGVATVLTRSAVGHSDKDDDGLCDVCDVKCAGIYDGDTLVYKWKDLINDRFEIDVETNDITENYINPFKLDKINFKGSYLEFLTYTNAVIEDFRGKTIDLYIPSGYNLGDNFLKAFKDCTINVHLDPSYLSIGEDNLFIFGNNAFSGVSTLYAPSYKGDTSINEYGAKGRVNYYIDGND